MSAPVAMYYDDDLAWVHDTGFARYATRAASEIVRLLGENGVASATQ